MGLLGKKTLGGNENSTKHKGTLPVMAAFLFLCVLTLTGCDPKRGVPQGAISAAYASSQFCPVDGCEVEIGPSTTRLPSSDSDVRDRWCIEVIYNRGGLEFQVAVEVIQEGPEPETENSWSVKQRIYEADCEVLKESK